MQIVFIFSVLERSSVRIFPRMSSSESNNKKASESTEGKTPLIDATSASGSTESAGNEEQPPAKEMKAVVLTAHGGLKGLKVQNRNESVASEGEVLIRVKAW